MLYTGKRYCVNQLSLPSLLSLAALVTLMIPAAPRITGLHMMCTGKRNCVYQLSLPSLLSLLSLAELAALATLRMPAQQCVTGSRMMCSGKRYCVNQLSLAALSGTGGTGDPHDTDYAAYHGLIHDVYRKALLRKSTVSDVPAIPGGTGVPHDTATPRITG